MKRIQEMRLSNIVYEKLNGRLSCGIWKNVLTLIETRLTQKELHICEEI